MGFRTTVKRFEPVLLLLIALIFTAGLMFASAELPRVVDRLLDNNVDFLDVATGQDRLAEYKTELFLSHYHIRLIGYACLGLILILIVTGFVLEKRACASAGAVLLFLPVFGHFAATMFFLGGLAFLRFLWLPLLDISFDVMRLGDIVLLPYKWILDAGSRAGINLYRELPFIITGLGIFIFLLGVLAWMFGRIRKREVTDFWIYRMSRHPQYLGWIIWSYGVLFLPGANMKQYVTVSNTLPWLLSTMVIIGVALLEERIMKLQFTDAYESYRRRASFLFPLPRFVRKIFSLPLWLVSRKAYPDTKREIVLVVSLYTGLCILLSGFSTGTIRPSKNETASGKSIEQLVHQIKTAHNRGDIRHAAASLAAIGGAAVDSLISLLENENAFVRWYCADALGSVRSEKVVQPLASLLDDPDQNVRRTAANSLGGTGSDRAVRILIDAFLDPDKGVQSDAARSLGKLGAGEAVPALIQGLKSHDAAASRWCAWALGEIGAEQAVEPLAACTEQREDCDFSMVGDALRKLGSDRAADAYIAGLKSSAWWIQAGCATALGEMQSEKGFAALAEALRSGEVQVRRAAVLALSKYPGRQAEPALREALNNEDWEVRMYAKEALHNISDGNE